MSEHLIDKTRIVRYWLGQMSPEEETDFEVECFSDDEQSEWCNSVRTGLIDLYARGKLRGDNLLRFEQHFLDDPHHRELVAFARTNQPQAQTVAAAATAPVAVPWGQRLRALLGLEAFSWAQLALTTGALIAVAGLSLAAWRNFFTGPATPGPVVARVTPTPVTVAAPTAAPTPAPATPKPQPAASAQPTAAPAPTPTPAPRLTPTPTPPPLAETQIARLELGALHTKGSGSAGDSVLTIKPDTKTVQITLPNPAGCRRCQGVIKSTDGSGVHALPVRFPPAKGKWLTLNIAPGQLPANKFPAGEYVLELTGQDERGKPVTIPWIFSLAR